MELSAIIIIILVGILSVYVFYLVGIYIKLENRNSLILTKFTEIETYLEEKQELLTKLVELTNDEELKESVNKMRESIRVNDKIKYDKLINSILKNRTYDDKKIIKLEKEIDKINEKINYSKEFYNDSLYEYNMILSTISGKIIQKIFKYVVYSNY